MAEQNNEEHYLKEAPYLVMDAGMKSWGAHCVCGWRSTLYNSEDELLAVFHEHKANPGPPRKKKKWWQKTDFDYDDRRHR
jgi:hypothetical protein